MKRFVYICVQRSVTPPIINHAPCVIPFSLHPSYPHRHRFYYGLLYGKDQKNLYAHSLYTIYTIIYIYIYIYIYGNIRNITLYLIYYSQDYFICDI